MQRLIVYEPSTECGHSRSVSCVYVCTCVGGMRGSPVEVGHLLLARAAMLLAAMPPGLERLVDPAVCCAEAVVLGPVFVLDVCSDERDG